MTKVWEVRQQGFPVRLIPAASAEEAVCTYYRQSRGMRSTPPVADVQRLSVGAGGRVGESFFAIGKLIHRMIVSVREDEASTSALASGLREEIA